MGRVDGKVALVTGAARGQGRNHAVRLAESGADVIVLDACMDLPTVPYALGSADELAETALLVEQAGRRVFSAKADVRDYAGFAAAVDAGVSELGRLDIVVANAGILSVGAPLDEAKWREMIDVNLTGVWITTATTTPHIIAGGRGGAIVLISSIAGLKGIQNFAHYVAAKHGVVGLMRTLSNELAPHRIRVNTIHPTNVDTPMIMNDALLRVFVPGVDEPSEDQFRSAAASMNAIDVPWIEMDDVSNALLFLVSDEARYVTGVTLPIDAGYTSKA